MKLYNIYDLDRDTHGIYDDTFPAEGYRSEEEYPIYGGGTNDNDVRIRRAGTGYDTLWDFLSSFIITLLLICLAAGLLFVDKSARESAGIYENTEIQTELALLLEQLSSLRWIVRGIFPYFILVVELLLLLCRLFSIIARVIL